MQLRTQSPFGCNSSSDWGNDNYYPNPNWGEYGNDDYPTVLAHKSGTSNITRSVEFADWSSYSLPNKNGCSALNVENFYTERSLNGNPYTVKHNTGKGASWIYGHGGPASSNSAVYSWQRNVIGFSWQYQTGGTNSAGLSPENVILLYRESNWTGKFFGAWLIKDGYYATGTRRQHFGSKLWDEMPDYKAERSGKVSINVYTENNQSGEQIRSGNLCFQGIWFDMRTNDRSPVQFENKHYMWNCRLIFDDSGSSRDESTRIVLPRKWTFSSAFDRTKPLRLT